MKPRVGNVLFITADQWRGDCLSALGHSCLRTPHLDALARDGVLFRRRYAQASPCGPSRASLYTALYLHNHRSVINGTPLASLFFDLVEDPMEFNNLAEVHAYRDQMLTYAQKLLSWRMNYDDRALTHVRLSAAGPVTYLDRRQ